jgi:hypothetical protein
MTIISSSDISTRHRTNLSLSSIDRESAARMADFSAPTEVPGKTSTTVGGDLATEPPGVVGRLALDMAPG